MKRFYLHIIPLLCLLFCMNSCTPPDDDEIKSVTYYLCRNTWTNYYFENNVECTQTLQFNENGTGKELFARYYSDYPEYTEYTFQWRWTSESYNTIELEYGPYDFIYFESVRVSDRLSGFFDGIHMYFDK